MPAPVAAMIDDYRALRAERPDEWGGEFTGMAQAFPYARRLGPELLFLAESGADWPDQVRQRLGDRLPAGLVVVGLGPGGRTVRSGAPPYALPGAGADVAVLLDSALDEPATVDVDGVPTRVEPRGVALVTLAPPGGPEIVIGRSDRVPAGTPAGAARLRLRAGAPSRWSVTDDRGGAWFPDGALRRWDYHGRPLFHGDDLELDVPAVPLTIGCGRGMEYTVVETTLTPAAGTTAEVELRPVRRYPTAARGWYGGDLHVHMNYSGDEVCAPDDAAAMQLGEGLHLMNLVAGNIGGARVYDQAAFESTAGEDLPWTTADRVARFGVEFRNDLLGHVHALGPTRPPTRYHTGHEGSDHPFDWPANTVACEEFRAAGGTVAYTHPVFSALSDGTPAGAFRFPRSVEARELVADAALGLVDSMDLIGPNDVEGTALLYHHLLSCGVRLAATVGTDVWLSFSRGQGFSNPPGWARVYADLRGAPLSVGAFQDAIRAGRTFATTGPWVELAVDGHAPGDVLPVGAGRPLRVVAGAEGPGLTELQIVGPDGVIARTPVDGAGAGAATVDVEVTPAESLWLCAVARGPAHPSVPGPAVFAHTSPVYVHVDGRPVSRAASARWLLDWLDRFEAMLRADGRFSTDAQRDEVVDVIEQARPYYRAQLS